MAGHRRIRAEITGDMPAPPQRTLPLGGRPTEAASGLGLAASVYGFLTQAGVPTGWSALVAVAIAFAPLCVSELVDAVHARR
jgi:hypothetical protein